MPYQLVIFDMDGTLTEELLDFAAIRQEIGLPEGVGILEHISHLTGPAADRAQAILHRHEMTAADNCALHDGAVEVLERLRREGVRRALLTRNSTACAHRILHRHALAFDHISTRDNPPHKPHRDSILNITRGLAIDPRQTLMVGDYLYDVQAAQNAGVDSALLCAKYGAALPPFAAMATYRIANLREIVDLIGKNLSQGAVT